MAPLWEVVEGVCFLEAPPVVEGQQSPDFWVSAGFHHCSGSVWPFQSSASADSEGVACTSTAAAPYCEMFQK